MALVLAGCTPHFKLAAIRAELPAFPSARDTARQSGGLSDFRGVIHVHSRVSHDSEGTPDEILAAAREADLDFIIMTDHDSPEIFTHGLAGRHGKVLVIRGMEIIKGCRGGADRCASLLAIGLTEYFDHRPLTFQEVVNEVRRQGGIAIVAHPRGWRDWSVEGLTGLEIYDTLDDVMDKKWKFPKYFFDILYSYRKFPAETFLSIQDRPAWHLAQWDELNRTKRLTGIAGNDAHQNVRVLGRQLDPYSLSFRYVTTHVLADALTRDGILQALRAGRAYVAFDLLSDSSGFSMELHDSGPRGLMGDELPLHPALRLETRLPRPALVLIFRNGTEVARCHCRRYVFPLPGPGVYRSEVMLQIRGKWRPWILSNPVYIR